MSNSTHIRYRICQSAIVVFREKGFHNTTMSAIAEHMKSNESELYTYFGSKEDITLFLFQSINTDWNLQVQQLSEAKLGDRFEKALLAKVELIDPYTDLLADIMGLLLRNPKIGVYAPRTAHIRTIGQQTIQTIIDGAIDSGKLHRKIDQLAGLLYKMHWGVLFLHIQSGSKEQTAETIRFMAKSLEKATKLSVISPFTSLFGDLNKLASTNAEPSVPNESELDNAILKVVFNHRKTTDAHPTCLDHTCPTCFALHRHKISHFTQQQLPIHFILPAFPAKSPNHLKVLGSLPDLGEEIALRTLEDLCTEINTVYPPGASVTICSDGRIFSDLVGVTDQLVSDYVKGIKQLISQLELQHVNIINLEDVLQGDSFDVLREQVITDYAEPLDELRLRLTHSSDFKNLFNGIHRFITDDRKVTETQLSATKIKEESKLIALKVIQHSNAWTRLLAYVYPDAVRLSIHPYAAHSEKIGIRLTKAVDNWLTPWHGVVVLQEDGYVLMKKSDAEKAEAVLVTKNDQPFYYTAIPTP